MSRLRPSSARTATSHCRCSRGKGKGRRPPPGKNMPDGSDDGCLMSDGSNRGREIQGVLNNVLHFFSCTMVDYDLKYSLLLRGCNHSSIHHPMMMPPHPTYPHPYPQYPPHHTPPPTTHPPTTHTQRTRLHESRHRLARARRLLGNARVRVRVVVASRLLAFQRGRDVQHGGTQTGLNGRKRDGTRRTDGVKGRGG
jgi:hypothetical protein